MSSIYKILLAILIFYGVFNVLAMIFMFVNDVSTLAISPREIAELHDINLFGGIFLFILFVIMFPLFNLIYWIGKLFHWLFHIGVN